MRRMSLILVGVAVVAAGCGGESTTMASPTGPEGARVASPSFVSMSPGGGAMGVPVGNPLELHWGTAMGVGMEQYVDLHMGDLSGPVFTTA